jgi:20S proteasome alpha/beta subunit
MRTAEEILKSHYYTRQDPEINIDDMIVMINEARKEAIEECYKKAELDLTNDFKGCVISETPFLRLIDELELS